MGLSDVVADSLRQVKEYVNEHVDNWTNPYLARCLVAMQECILHYDLPCDLRCPEVIGWRAFNDQMLADGENPLMIEDYFASVGEPVADEQVQHPRLRNWLVYNRARVASGEAELMYHDYILAVGQAVAESGNGHAGP